MACMICRHPGGFWGGLYLACGVCTMIVGRPHLESLQLRLKSFISAISLDLSLGTDQGWIGIEIGIRIRVTGCGLLPA